MSLRNTVISHNQTVKGKTETQRCVRKIDKRTETNKVRFVYRVFNRFSSFFHVMFVEVVEPQYGQEK